jgi:hypothetical protein
MSGRLETLADLKQYPERRKQEGTVGAHKARAFHSSTSILAISTVPANTRLRPSRGLGHFATVIRAANPRSNIATFATPRRGWCRDGTLCKP